MVHPSVIVFLIGILVPVTIARPPKTQNERRHFDEDRPEAVLNCTTTGNGRKSSTTSHAYVKSYDKHNSHMDMSIYLDEPQQSSITKSHDRPNKHPKPHRKMVIRMVPVPVLINSDEEEEPYHYEFPYKGLHPGIYHKGPYIDEQSEEDMSEISSEDDLIGSVVSEDKTNPSQCDENVSKPCTEEQDNPTGSNLQSSVVTGINEEYQDSSSEEEFSDIETNVNQRVGLKAMDSTRPSQLSQNVKISNRISNINDTNSSNDCIKHHIIQIININSKDLENENNDQWYDIEDEAKSLSDDILVNGFANKTAITKDLVLLLKRILSSADTAVSQEHRDESISYVKKEENYNSTNEDLTIRTDETESRTIEEEKGEEEEDVVVDQQENNTTTIIEDQKQSESWNYNEEEIQENVSNEKFHTKRSSLERTGTLEQRDPSKSPIRIHELNPNVEESSAEYYKHHDIAPKERTMVQKIPRKRKLTEDTKYSIPLPTRDSLSPTEAKGRSKRNIPEDVQVFNIEQNAFVRNKKRRKSQPTSGGSVPKSSTTTNIEQGVTIYDNSKSNKKRIIKIKRPGNEEQEVCSDENGISKDNELEQGLVYEETLDNNFINSYDNPSSGDVIVQDVEIDEENGRIPETVERPCEEEMGCKNSNEDIPEEEQITKKVVDVDDKCKKIFQILNLVPHKFLKEDKQLQFPQIINQVAQIFPSSGRMRNNEETYPYPLLTIYEDGDSKN